MTTRFTCDFTAKGRSLAHFWEHCVGSGHATLALRQDWQAQLKQCRDELGFRHVRFHGLLCDDLNTVIDEGGERIYSFHNIDRIFDFIRSIDMRPVVELSFMPTALASGDKTTFHYRANVTPPADYGDWAALVSKLSRHWIDRFGANEVASWPMEVWNEPNLDSFWTGNQQDYFHLYEVTHKALKHVHPDLKVGGPASAQNAWIGEFIDFCSKAGVPPDFVSTHTYPTDARGSADDDTEETLSKSKLGILRARAQKVRKQAGKLPLYYTEWCTSSNPRDPLHDEPYAAAYITQAMLNMGDLVDAYSYWTFSDIFEENYFPSRPFQGGFGLLTIHGIAKPAYRAFEILHGLGDTKLPVKGQHDTVQVWVVRDESSATVVIVNLALPLHPVEPQTVNVELFGLPNVATAQMRRIDAGHANAKASWKAQGEPEYPTADEMEAMKHASRLAYEPVDLKNAGHSQMIEVTVAAQSVTAIELNFTRPQRETSTGKLVPASPHAFCDKDQQLLERLQSGAFGYFTEHANPDNGLVADNSRTGSAASIAATGFALSCYPVAAERGWMSRKQAAEITLRTLEFFAASRQGPDASATGHKGFYYHFLTMKTGKRARKCELSTIDTAMLLAGMLVAEEYFDRANAAERRIRSIAGDLFEHVDWNWALDNNGEINQCWTPEKGFLHADWDGYTEALLLYVLGASSTSHPLSREVYERDTRDYRWHHNAGLDWIHAAPLFIHLIPQAWIDLRGPKDGFIGQRQNLDYAENTRRAIAVQRDYAWLNSHNHTGYDRDIWGLSACAGPEGEMQTRDGRIREFLGYAARGVTAAPDDGTLVPWAAATCLAHAPEVAMSGLRAMLDTYPRALRDDRFVGAINPSLPGDGPEGWIAPACYGIDQGLVVMMIENARSGLIWNLTRQSRRIRRGMKNLGFSGGWLG